MTRHLIPGVIFTLSVAAMWPSICMAHGPTLCIGAVQVSSETSITVDLRFGVGVMDKYVDPDDSATVSPDEWTSSTPVLKPMFLAGSFLRHGDATTTPSDIQLFLTSGSEIQVLARFDVPTTATQVALALPVLRKLTGAPPAQMSAWKGTQMLSSPELLWFDREMQFDRSK